MVRLTLTPSVAERRAYNGALACLHLALALACGFVPAVPDIPLGTPVPVWGDDECDPGPLCTVVGPPVLLASLGVRALAFFFFAATALAHAVYSSRAEEYARLVQERRMWWRWAEYAVTVPPMLLIIAALNGLTLDAPLLQTATLGSAAQLFGLAAEEAAARGDVGSALRRHALGYPVVAAALLPVAVSLGELPGSGAPSFVPLIIATQGIFFISFGAVQTYTLARLRADLDTGAAQLTYARADTVYLFLSLACKATLGASLVLAASQLDDAGTA